MDIFDAALIKMFYDFVKTNGGPSSSSTPIETAIVNNKQFVSVRQGPRTGNPDITVYLLALLC
jgi:hypothetical protein